MLGACKDESVRHAMLVIEPEDKLINPINVSLHITAVKCSHL